jgi:ATP-dependent Lon protease
MAKSAMESPRKCGVPGVVTALALTPTGGVTTSIECLLLSGRGRLILTGNLVGEAKDSCQVALSLARSRARRFGINPAEFLRTDVHFHVPEGLPAKDGPSAGLAMLVALVSAMTRQAVDPGLAFTGEISLSGKIHAISGLPEKSAAALKAGVTRVYAPKDNVSEAGGLETKKKKGFEIAGVDHIDIVLEQVFGKVKTRRL